MIWEVNMADGLIAIYVYKKKLLRGGMVHMAKNDLQFVREGIMMHGDFDLQNYIIL